MFSLQCSLRVTLRAYSVGWSFDIETPPDAVRVHFTRKFGVLQIIQSKQGSYVLANEKPGIGITLYATKYCTHVWTRSYAFSVRFSFWDNIYENSKSTGHYAVRDQVLYACMDQP